MARHSLLLESKFEGRNFSCLFRIAQAYETNLVDLVQPAYPLILTTCTVDVDGARPNQTCNKPVLWEQSTRSIMLQVTVETTTCWYLSKYKWRNEKKQKRAFYDTKTCRAKAQNKQEVSFLICAARYTCARTLYCNRQARRTVEQYLALLFRNKGVKVAD